MAEVHDDPAGLGNPTGSHPPAQRARRLLEEARDEVAAFLGRDPGDIVFTSGGTESANLAVLGPGRGGAAGARRGGRAVLGRGAPGRARVGRGPRRRPASTCRELPVDAHGIVDHDALARTLSSRVHRGRRHDGQQRDRGRYSRCTTSSRRCAGAPRKAYVFTDAVQAAPYLDLAEATAGADLVSLSAHKVGGPVGVGALAVERSRRARSRASTGAGRSASGAAAPRTWPVRSGWPPPCAWWRPSAPAPSRASGRFGTGWPTGCWASVEGAQRTVPPSVGVLPGHLHLCVPGVEREELLVALGEEGVCVSGGSSCASGALQPSHVLAAMGVAPELAAGALRFTLGYGTTEADVDRALAVVPAVVAALRRD